MPQSANIKITTHGAGVGPFNIYTLDSSNNVIQTLELNVPLSKLTTVAGYNIFNISDAAAFIKIQSNNTLCSTIVNAALV
jgi:hypothetical protein